jgi:hypothetical protein
MDIHKIAEEVTNFDKARFGLTTRIGRVWRSFWGLRPLYWLRCHTFTRYHIIDIRDEKYRWGWIDRSHAMLLANFKILVEFIEKERPFDVIDWDSDVDHQHARSEMMELYEWWKRGREAEADAVDAFFEEHHRHPAPGDEFPLGPDGMVTWNTGTWDTDENESTWFRMYTDLEKRDDEMLARLIKIRNFLWT